ncbi:MAG: hypothetical protein EXR86_00970 [Gammaproteobacteria bacterium]|nr:hypothetical protein [Gammaproteobacteria bacterium]
MAIHLGLPVLTSKPTPRPHVGGLAWMLTLLAIAAWYFPFTASARFAGFMADDALYLLMADFFSPFHPREPVLTYLRSMSHLPPFYSVVLGFLGAGSTRIAFAHVIQTTLMLAALHQITRLAEDILQDRTTALLLLGGFALAPATLLFSTEIWSEFLYLLCATTSILCLSRGNARARCWLAAAVFAGLAAITRGSGIALIGALLITAGIRKRQLFLPVAGVALLPLIVVASARFGGSIDYLGIFRRKVGDPVVLGEVLVTNATAIASGLLRSFALAPSLGLQLCGSVFGLAAMMGFYKRLGRCEFDGFYVIAYLGLILIWPFPEVVYRLVYPIVPLLMIYACDGVKSATGAARAGKVWARGLSILLLITVITSSAPMLWKYVTSPLPAALADFRASRYWLAEEDANVALRDIAAKQAMIRIMRQARDVVPVGACIYSLDPQATMLYSRHLSWPAETGANRAAPLCRYHLLLSDNRFRQASATLWPGYIVERVERTPEGVAAILVRYPQKN